MLLQDHFCVSIRTSRCYAYFTTAQLLLTSSILLVCYHSALNLASFLEIVIAFCLALDLIIRHFSERKFLQNKHNIYDLVLLGMMLVTIVAHEVRNQVGGHEEGQRNNRYIALGLIVVRYCSQVVRFGVLLWRTKEENTKKIEEIVMEDGKGEGEGEGEEEMTVEDVVMRRRRSEEEELVREVFL